LGDSFPGFGEERALAESRAERGRHKARANGLLLKGSAVSTPRAGQRPQWRGKVKHRIGMLRKRKWGAVLGLAAVLFIVVIWEEVAFRVRSPNVCSQGCNAIWVRHCWLDQPHAATEYRALARKLAAMRISDAYVHAGPLNADGTVSPRRIRYAKDLLDGMKKISPGLRIQAWLGQVECGGGGPLKLSSAAVRKGIVRTCERLLELGFDGIHVDIEPIWSGNRDFIRLLRQIHTLTRSRHAVLSVAAYKPERVRGIGWAAGVIARNPGYWTREYFLEVAGEVDQVAVMCYDTATPLPSLYGRSIAWMVRWSVGHGVDNLIVGVPTYDNRTASHYPYVENITNALRGVKRGVAALDEEDRKHVGVGIFAEWTTSGSEWETYRSMWLNVGDRKRAR
jgi:hypothetical protein